MSMNLINNVVSSLSTVVAIPPPSGALESLDHAIRNDLQSWRTLFFNWLLVTTGIVAIGVIMEAPEIWYEVGTAILGLRRKKTEHRHAPPLVTISAAIGWLLIVLGVVGELFTDGLVSWADAKLQNFDEIVLEDTLRTAGNARESAIDAADAAARAVTGEEMASERLDKARREIDAAQLALEKQLTWQGPRWVVINANRALFKAHLQQFSGQSFVWSICWGQYMSRGDQEISTAANSLAMNLADSGWKPEPPSGAPTMDRSCGTIGEGVSFFIRSDAPKRTQDAAKMLLAVTDTVLKQGDVVSPLDARGLQDMRLTTMQPDTIDILVKMHTLRPSGPTADDVRLLKGDKP